MSVVKVDKQIFEQQVIEEKKAALVEFWAPWCVYCRRIGPAFEKIADEYGDNLVVGQINIDDEEDLAVKYGIEVVPSILLFKDGEVAGAIVAPESKGKIVEFINDNL